MEIVYRAKGQLNYQSNLTSTQRYQTLIQVDARSNAVEAPIILSPDTAEISNYLDTIEAQNEKLREISWIQSHIVRGPLARIMGLIQIIDDSKDDDELGTILKYISLSAKELDNAIKQISDKSIPVSI